MNTTSTGSRVEQLADRLQPLYDTLATHRLYSAIHTIADLRIFMESHIFAVWDFMSLLKALQHTLTCVDTPWLPSSTPESRRLINEIVLGEESDIYRGHTFSHFEIYRMAMHACGAATVPIDNLLHLIRDGLPLDDAITQCGASQPAIDFVRSTFKFIAQGKTHTIAAAFTFGREDLIPTMFKSLVRDLDRSLEGQLEPFIWYLERHIEVDGEEHGPMALRMINDLCGEDEHKWHEAELAAVTALEARLRLWDGIADSIRQQ